MLNADEGTAGILDQYFAYWSKDNAILKQYLEHQNNTNDLAVQRTDYLSENDLAMQRMRYLSGYGQKAAVKKT